MPTEEIHHKLPLSEGGTHDRSNLIALCKSCHGAIHAKKGGLLGRAALIAHTPGGVEISTGTAPRERRVGLTCKIAK